MRLNITGFWTDVSKYQLLSDNVAAAIYRFVRPVAYQNFPDAALPQELRNKNVRKLWRLVDSKMTQEDL